MTSLPLPPGLAEYSYTAIALRERARRWKLRVVLLACALAPVLGFASGALGARFLEAEPRVHEGRRVTLDELGDVIQSRARPAPALEEAEPLVPEE